MAKKQRVWHIYAGAWLKEFAPTIILIVAFGFGVAGALGGAFSATHAAVAMVTIVAFIGLMLGVSFLLLRQARSRNRRYLDEMALIRASVDLLPYALARQRATVVLRRRNVFDVREACGVDPRLSALDDSTRELFSTYESIRLRNGDLRLARSLISPSLREKGLIRIGEDMGELEICVDPSTGQLHTIESDTHAITESLGVYPSIYHWILVVAAQNER
ncbi:MAG: hypothetical protein KIS87_12820 [Phycisphaeraceae bacterium]|nr:hypothetical protein [Phycisphaeraceae bacterium]